MNHQAILDSFSLQLATLQQSIANRTENPGLPTEKDITMQVRLMTCIDKMSRVIAREAKEAAKQKGQPPVVTEQPEAITPSASPGNQYQLHPLSEEVLSANVHLLNNCQDITSNDAMIVCGRRVNKMWFVYNVFQLHRLQKDRIIADEETFSRTIKIEDAKHEIAVGLGYVKAA